MSADIDSSLGDLRDGITDRDIAIDRLKHVDFELGLLLPKIVRRLDHDDARERQKGSRVVLADIRAIQKNVQLAISTLLGRKVNRQRACYELAVTSSLSWREIGEKVGLSTSGARKAAVTYATRNKLVAVPQRRADTPRSTPALH